MRVVIHQIDHWLSVSACHAGLLGGNRTPVGSVRWLSAQKSAGPTRLWRMRSLDHHFSSCVPEPRCQQALPGDRGVDFFGSAMP
jgi:hypothetical protein